MGSWRSEDPHFEDPVWEDRPGVCVYVGGEGVCRIKWIFPSICEVPVWSLDIENISGYPPAIASPTFIGLQARKDLQWALSGVLTLGFGVEHGAFLTPDIWSQWTTYAETWHMLLWVVESYHPQMTVSHGNHSSHSSSCWGLWINWALPPEKW